MMPTEIKHIPIYTHSLQSQSTNINYNKVKDENVKTMTEIRNNKSSVDIEIELLKIAYFLPEFNKKYLYFM